MKGKKWLAVAVAAWIGASVFSGGVAYADTGEVTGSEYTAGEGIAISDTKSINVKPVLFHKKTGTGTVGETGLVLGGETDFNYQAGFKNDTSVLYGSSGSNSVTVGGKNLTAHGVNSVAMGGNNIQAYGENAVAIGGFGNAGRVMEENENPDKWPDQGATGQYSVTLGGNNVRATEFAATGIGGYMTQATGRQSVSIGGTWATASGQMSLVAGGAYNVASGSGSSIIGGGYNTASGEGSLITGGNSNNASGDWAVLVGGVESISNGELSLTLGGANSIAQGETSVAIGGGATGSSAAGAVAIGSGSAVTTENGLALGKGAVTNTDGTIAFGHDKGDKYYEVKWQQLDESDEDGNTNDYSKPSYVKEATYDSSGYNRLVKIADGINAHDAVAVDQLTELKAGSHVTIADGETKNELGQTVKTISVETNGKVESGDTNIVTGGNVYDAITSAVADNTYTPGEGITIGDGTSGTTKNQISVKHILGHHSQSYGDGSMTVSTTNSLTKRYRGKEDNFHNTYAGKDTGWIIGGETFEDNIKAGETKTYGATGLFAVNLGGKNLLSSGIDAVSAAGNGNVTSGDYAFSAGGDSNATSGEGAASLAGYKNKTSGEGAAVIGGSRNLAGKNEKDTGKTDYSLKTYYSGKYAVAVGGSQNMATGNETVAIGGSENKAEGVHSVVSGGNDNLTAGEWGFIGGGNMNVASGSNSSILGGTSNVAETYATAVGGSTNKALGRNATAAGGIGNQAVGYMSTVSAGVYNEAAGSFSYAAGGYNGKAIGDWSTAIGGGQTGKNASQAVAIGSGSVVTVTKGMALGNGSVTTEAGTISFGHKKGDVSRYTVNYEMEDATDEHGNVIKDHAGKTVQVVKEQWNKDTYRYEPVISSITETTYGSDGYNRLVKIADGVDSHDAVTMNQYQHATNVGANLKKAKIDDTGSVVYGDDGQPVMVDADAADKAASKNEWSDALGNPLVTNKEEEGSRQLITSGAVHNEVRPTDGNYVKTTNTTAANLTALDTKLGAIPVKAASEASAANAAGTGYNYIAADNSVSQNLINLDEKVKADVNDAANKYKEGDSITFSPDGDKTKINVSHVIHHKFYDSAGKTFSRNGVVLGGETNLASGFQLLGYGAKGDNSVTVGGYNLAAVGTNSVALGGYRNFAVGTGSVAIGGYNDRGQSSGVNEYNNEDGAVGQYSVTVGGFHINASGDYSASVGGYFSKASGQRSVVVGGYGNTASERSTVIVGGISNSATAKSSSVFGGFGNTAGGTEAMKNKDVGSSVFGGMSNIAIGQLSAVVGGGVNTASGDYSLVLGGDSNVTQGVETAVLSGTNNKATSDYAVIVGGDNNTASGMESNIFGASQSVASGIGSAVFGGGNSIAQGMGSIAIGGGATGADAASAIAVGTGSAVTVESGLALGNQAVTDEAGTIAFGHDAGDKAYTLAWEQLEKPDENGNTNDYSKAPTVKETTYENAQYNRLVKIADGKDAHDAVAMDQLTELKAGSHVTIADGETKNELGQTVKTISVETNGKVESGDTNIVTGDTVYKAINQVNETVGNASISYKANGKDAKSVKLSDGLDFKDSTNTTASVGENGEVKYSLKDDINLTSVTTGNTVMNNEGITITNGTNISSLTSSELKVGGKTYIDGSGLNANNQKITNVSDGTIAENSKDAVNGGQLHNALANKKTEITTDLTDKGFGLKDKDGKAVTAKLGEQVEVDGDDNVTVAVDETNKKLNVQLNKNLDLGGTGSLKIGDVVSISNAGITAPMFTAGSVSFSSGGINAGNKKITNLAPGVNGTDAVNMDQLNAAVDRAMGGISIKAGKGIAVTKDGTQFTIAANIGNSPTISTTEITANTENPQNAARQNGLLLINELVRRAPAAKPEVDTGEPVTLHAKPYYVYDDSEQMKSESLGGNLCFHGDGNISTVVLDENTEHNGKAIKGTKILLKVNKDLNLTSVTTGDTKIDNSGLSVDGKTYVGHDGLNANDQKVTNVAPGEIAPTSTDAVNGAQMFQASQTIGDLSGRVSRLDGRIDKVGAGAAALAALHPQDYDADDKFSVAAGYGSYRDAHAVAVGAFYRPNERTMLSFGASMGNGENMVNAGLSMRFGHSSPYAGLSRAELVARLQSQTAEIESLKAENQAQKEENQAQKAENEAQNERISKLEAMVEKLAAK